MVTLVTHKGHTHAGHTRLLDAAARLLLELARHDVVHDGDGRVAQRHQRPHVTVPDDEYRLQLHSSAGGAGREAGHGFRHGYGHGRRLEGQVPIPCCVLRPCVAARVQRACLRLRPAPYRAAERMRSMQGRAVSLIAVRSMQGCSVPV